MSTVAQGDLEQHVTSSPLRESVRDLVAGAAGGVSQVLVGQPFDLVKVRLQTYNAGNALGITRDVFFKEGPLAFYKGSLMPFLGIGACVSIQFGAFHTVRKILEDQNSRKYGPSGFHLSLPQYYFAGAAAGVANSIVSTPVELVRIKLQTQPHGIAKVFSGPWDCSRQIVKRYGIPGLYHGNVACMMREFHGFGLWFVTFEALMNYDMRRQGRGRSEIPLWNVALYGGLAGEAFWLGVYPIDVVKSRQQSDGLGQNQKYGSMRAVVTDIWREQGMRGFFRGIVPTLARAILTSAVTFVTAEQVKLALS